MSTLDPVAVALAFLVLCAISTVLIIGIMVFRDMRHREREHVKEDQRAYDDGSRIVILRGPK